MAPSSEQPGQDELLCRLRKKSVGWRATEPIAELVDAVCERATECGCGEVGRDELIAALLVAADGNGEEELHDLIGRYRKTRVGDLSLEVTTRA